jgi:hypothetical protein
VAEIVAARAAADGNHGSGTTTTIAPPPLPVLLQMESPPQDHHTPTGQYETTATPVCGALYQINSTVDSTINQIMRSALRSSPVAAAHVDFVKLWRLTRRAQALANGTLSDNRLLFHASNDCTHWYCAVDLIQAWVRRLVDAILLRADVLRQRPPCYGTNTGAGDAHARAMARFGLSKVWSRT